MKRIVILLLFLSIPVFAKPTNKAFEEKISTIQKSVGVVESDIQGLETKVASYNEESAERYDRLASELSRDLTLIGIFVALFSLIVGVVVPLIINGENRRYYEREMEKHQKEFEKKLQEEDEKQKQFESDFAEFKKGYEIRILMESAIDANDNQKVELYSKVLAIDENYATALRRRAFAYRGLEMFPEAIADFKKLLALEPDNVSGYTSFGYTYYLANDDENAIKQYDKALELSPLSATALYYKSVSLYELKKYPEALSCVDKAIDQNPKILRYHVRRRKILKAISPVDNAAEIKKENEIIAELKNDGQN